MMATIIYGKGKTLRPTPLLALREKMDQHARRGKVEMLDIPPESAEKTVADAGNRMKSHHADVRAVTSVSAQLPEGSESSARMKRDGEKKRRHTAVDNKNLVRVRIHAPGVAKFFTTAKHEDLLVPNEEPVPD